ncbi:hypothetical protein Bca52824_076976 [Brassica carinata]|uniref:Uncharacterized protein n=1 Tax=Brassica carinata TaxID=52824 RepID=A0A8X7PVW4_BRACI|nr:hypothetical protein Bca52824_076976 [Brassica carinata]
MHIPFVAAQARLTQTPEIFVEDMLVISVANSRLYGRKFVVGNVARIGCLPYQRSTNQLKDKQCVDLTNKLTLQYNARLKDLLLVELKDSLKDVHFVYASDGERGVLWDGREIGGDIAMWTNVVSLQGPVKACSFGTRTSLVKLLIFSLLTNYCTVTPSSSPFNLIHLRSNI